MKKGFTLIELLAVIVILAIILVIAIPNIAGLIDSSKHSSFESDVKMIIKAIETKKQLMMVSILLKLIPIVFKMN